jgi:hypothetical protein
VRGREANQSTSLGTKKSENFGQIDRQQIFLEWGKVRDCGRQAGKSITSIAANSDKMRQVGPKEWVNQSGAVGEALHNTLSSPDSARMPH